MVFRDIPPQAVINIIRRIPEAFMNITVTDRKVGKPLIAVALSGNSDGNQGKRTVFIFDGLAGDLRGDRISSRRPVIVIITEAAEACLREKLRTSSDLDEMSAFLPGRNEDTASPRDARARS